MGWEHTPGSLAFKQCYVAHDSCMTQRTRRAHAGASCLPPLHSWARAHTPRTPNKATTHVALRRELELHALKTRAAGVAALAAFAGAGLAAPVFKGVALGGGGGGVGAGGEGTTGFLASSVGSSAAGCWQRFPSNPSCLPTPPTSHPSYPLPPSYLQAAGAGAALAALCAGFGAEAAALGGHVPPAALAVATGGALDAPAGEGGRWRSLRPALLPRHMQYE